MSRYAEYADFEKRVSPDRLRSAFPGGGPDDMQGFIEELLDAASFEIDSHLTTQVDVPVDVSAPTADNATFVNWLKQACCTITWMRAVMGTEVVTDALVDEYERIMKRLMDYQSYRAFVPESTGVLRTKKRQRMAKTTDDDKRLLVPRFWRDQRSTAGRH